jgi:hypothetical protein
VFSMTGSITGVRVVLLTTGDVKAQYETGNGTWTDIGTSSVLSVDVWHKVEISAENMTTVGGFGSTFNVDSANVGSVVNGTLFNPVVLTSVLTGPWVGGGTGAYLIDDIIVDDAGFVSGNGGVVSLQARANGTDTGWTGAASNVSELPADTTTTITQTTINVARTVVLEGAAAAGVSGTVRGLIQWVWSWNASGLTLAKLRLRSGATTSDTAGDGAMGTGSNNGNQLQKIFVNNPNTSAAWTIAGIDASEHGLFISANTGSVLCSCTQIMATVWCDAPTAPNNTPTVTAVDPTSGPKAGGTAVTITGTRLTGTTGVVIGGVACTAVTVVSGTSVTCTTAAVSKAGTYNVQVTTSGGIGVLVNAFTFLPGNSTGNSGNNAGGGTTVTVTYPAGLATGDMMCVTVTVRGGTGTTITPPTADGTWNLLSRVDSTTTLAQGTYWKLASAGDVTAGSAIFTITSNKASGVCVKVPDVEPVAPQVAQQANASSTSVTAPTLTPKRLGAVSIYGGGVATGTTFTPPTNWTEPASADTASTGGSAATRTTTEEAYRVLASLSATGTVVGTAASGAVNIGAQMIFEPPGLIDAPLIDNTGVVFAPTLSGAAPVAFVPYAPIYTPFLAQ